MNERKGKEKKRNETKRKEKRNTIFLRIALSMKDLQMKSGNKSKKRNRKDRLNRCYNTKLYIYIYIYMYICMYYVLVVETFCMRAMEIRLLIRNKTENCL